MLDFYAYFTYNLFIMEMINRATLTQDQIKIITQFKSAMCDGKRKHSTRTYAKKAAAKMQQKYSGEKFNAYKCQFCNQFHIGHKGSNSRYTAKILDPSIEVILETYDMSTWSHSFK